ncbi:DNA repair family protein [Lindgomyces ingoldianus]|uniref:DNA repair family protein n=1 Tax=Lindgomyces ingoldianus TaxID=673940 RepID=A0ACB6QDP7_9PLEO|nr:DNA repair family protein [Lindgomyces ingoldianus]KAF2465078.1 DNA repair family protein [Lindgomyces ingoldianus]
MKRSTLDMFIKPAAKKPKYEASLHKSNHVTYPFAVSHLPAPFTKQLGTVPVTEGKPINDQPNLDLVYYQPYIPVSIQAGMFEFLRQELFFYRVQYSINRGGIQTQVNTPRFTTVFGVDATSRFNDNGDLVDAKTNRPLLQGRYKCKPRPIPQCLNELRKLIESVVGENYNFCLVNYYADGSDSIAYHSDDERFLGADPAIASLSLGAKRDFLLRHKTGSPGKPRQIKLPLGSGDMVLMRGKTQANWLHSIPKRVGEEAKKGRINITFRKALVKGGTDNYYMYNVGGGCVFRWDDGLRRMMLWREGDVAGASRTEAQAQGGTAGPLRAQADEVAQAQSVVALAGTPSSSV